jgi:hypothetical protein
MTWLLGLDLGQSNDPTALAVVERTGAWGAWGYQVRHLERWLGVSYPEQVQRVQTLLRTPELAGATLLIDRTGVGRAVGDMFADEVVQPIGVTVHGGDSVSRDGPHYRVPKRDLIFSAVAVLQQRRLKIARGLTEAATLVQELQNFKIKIDPATAHDSYSAWREGQHDDLVFALSLALWAGENDIAGGIGIWSLNGGDGWYPSERAQLPAGW